MASVRSLGLHAPSGLQFLIAEGYLPEDPSPSLYRWNSYDDSLGFEEVLGTDRCVVWSCASVVKKAFSFDAENETVEHAVLTWFPTDDAAAASQELGTSARQQFSSNPNEGADAKQIEEPTLRNSAKTEHLSRALVVFLKRQAHIYFLSGASHVVHLHFDVDRVFPVPQGVIISRKNNVDLRHRPSTPTIPKAPPNSFLSPFAPRIGQLQSAEVHHKSTDAGGLDFDALRRKQDASAGALPRHFCLTSPSSEVGLVVSTPNVLLNGSSTRTQTQQDVVNLSAEDEMLYVSRVATVSEDLSPLKSPLVLAVTANKERHVYTIWQAMYANSKSASQAYQRRTTSTDGTKTRRRSSFVHTGATTPALKPGDNPGDSFVSRARGKKLSTFNASQSTAISDIGAEDLLASQLDLDFEPRQPAKASRVSSMISRADLSTNQDKSAFQELASQNPHRQSFGPHGRRGPSLGGPTSRTSLGYGSQRRLRSSTPGAFSRLSLDDMSENGTIVNFGLDDATMHNDVGQGDDILSRQAELDSLDIRLPFNGLRREMLFYRVAEIPMSDSLPLRYSFGSVSQTNMSASVHVFATNSHCMASESQRGGRRHFLHLVNRDVKEHIVFEYFIQQQEIQPSDPQSLRLHPTAKHELGVINVAAARKITRLKGQVDARNIEDNGASRVLCLRHRVDETILQIYAPWAPDTAYTISLERLRVFNPYDISVQTQLSPRAVGKQRTLLGSNQLEEILHVGSDGFVTVRATDRRLHRLQIRLMPRDRLTKRCLDVLLFVVPAWIGDYFLGIWWDRCRAQTNTLKAEWRAFVSVVFIMILALDDERLNRRTMDGVKNQSSPSRTRKSSAGSQDGLNRMLGLHKSWQDPGCHDHTRWVKLVDPEDSGGLKAVYLAAYIGDAQAFLSSPTGQEIRSVVRGNAELVKTSLARLIPALHLLREEISLHQAEKAGVGTDLHSEYSLQHMIAQLALWMDWSPWTLDGEYHELIRSCRRGIFDTSVIPSCVSHDHPLSRDKPASLKAWLETVSLTGSATLYPTLEAVLNLPMSPFLQTTCEQQFPRLSAMCKYFATHRAATLPVEGQVEAMLDSSLDEEMIETLPEAIVVLLREAIARCRASPPTLWSNTFLRLIDREDMDSLATAKQSMPQDIVPKHGSTIKDTHSINQAAESPAAPSSMLVPEFSDRFWISRLRFHDDRRLVEAMHLVEPLRTAVASCPSDPSWSEQQMLDAQKEVIQWVMIRTFALAPGNAMVHFQSKYPLLTEKFAIHGYSMLCKMQPMGNTVSADRAALSEDKYGWSWFHAGASAGLSISRHARGIDTSWIVFNRPPELTNRHAGLLLALGLNGHLSNVARWLSFKYLTPKHTMTSIGLLLGLSASHIGTMDTLVTRLLSVHITRMLPPGAAELNLSPLTQTAGLMGIGLLYHATQHRRMSEVMLSEIENTESVDPAETPVNVRDESYRLAAGFALGYINLGKGSDIRGLHDMRVIERLLAVAVGPRPVDLVHVLDQATSGATIAIALIFMKTGNKSLARKIDVPDTLPQFDYVRPDVLLLRTLAKHLILWDEIAVNDDWVKQNLPIAYRSFHGMRSVQTLKSAHMPFYYILAGLLWSIGLRHAGSGDKVVCTFLIKYLDRFIRLCKLPVHRYDAKLTRNTIRNCQDLVALACATVMAGTGDLDVMRRLRMLHGRTSADTPYGSHLAAHMALGTLFLGAGTYTLGSSNLAIASLVCAFYPQFPIDVTDNKAHLQPFRHFWVLAAEARCIVTREVDTNRPVRVPLTLRRLNGNIETLTTPCLLPELDQISQLSTSSPDYWPVTLDFEHNRKHMAAFKLHQTVYVRKRPAGSTHTNSFSATFLSLHEAQSTRLVGARKLFRSIFELPAFQAGASGLNSVDVSFILPADERSSLWRDGRGSVVDYKLLLQKVAKSGLDRNALWNLKFLFRWAEVMEKNGRGGATWLSQEVIKDLRGILEQRTRRLVSS